MSDMVRKWEPTEVLPRGWVCVEVPGYGTFLADEVLGRRVQELVAQNKVTLAKTLMQWFGADAVKEET